MSIELRNGLKLEVIVKDGKYFLQEEGELAQEEEVDYVQASLSLVDDLLDNIDPKKVVKVPTNEILNNSKITNFKNNGVRLIFLDGENRGYLGDIVDYKNIAEKRVFIVSTVFYESGGVDHLTINAENDNFAMRLRDCRWLVFIGINIKAGKGNGLDLLSGEYYRFDNFNISGGNFGFMVNRTAGSKLKGVVFNNCNAFGQNNCPFYVDGVGEFLNFNKCIGMDILQKSDRNQCFYISSNNDQANLTDCVAANGPMTGFQVRCPVNLTGCLATDVAEGFGLCPLDGFEGREEPEGAVIDVKYCGVYKTKAQYQGFYWNKAFSFKNLKAGKVDRILIQNSRDGIEIDGTTEKMQAGVKDLSIGNVFHREVDNLFVRKNNPIYVIGPHGEAIGLENEWFDKYDLHGSRKRMVNYLTSA